MAIGLEEGAGGPTDERAMVWKVASLGERAEGREMKAC